MRIEILSGLLGIALFAAPPTVATIQETEDFEELEALDDSVWNDFLPPTKEQAKRNAAMDKLLQGAWQLVELETEVMTDYGRHDRGIAIFGPGFFSLEMHIVFEPDWDKDIGGVKMFQSGSFRYRFDDEGNLLSKLSIGASFDPTLRTLDFSRPGSVRTFEIDITDNTLELRREPGGFRYEFTRLRSTDRVPVDVFGRPVADPLDDDSDFDPPNFEDPIERDEPEDDEEEEGRGGFDGSTQLLRGEPKARSAER